LEDGRDYAWTPATMHNSDHEERLFIGCVDDEVTADRCKTKRTRSEIGPLMALERKRNDSANRFQNILADAASSFDVVIGDKFPNIADI